MISKKNIMIISNEPDLPELLKDKLLAEGYGVTSTSENGENLRNLLDQTSPDLVIISMAVSCLAAVELSLRIRKWCHIPIILVSSWGTQTKLPADKQPGCLFMNSDTIENILLKVENTFSRN